MNEAEGQAAAGREFGEAMKKADIINKLIIDHDVWAGGFLRSALETCTKMELANWLNELNKMERTACHKRLQKVSEARQKIELEQEREVRYEQK